jgi:hypothetical protein
VGAALDPQDTKNFPIRGFFIFRGQEINWQILEECGDVEVYNWVKARFLPQCPPVFRCMASWADKL